MAPHIKSSASDAHEILASRSMQAIGYFANAGLNRGYLLRM